MNTQTPGPLYIDTLSKHISANGMTIAATYDLRHDKYGAEEDTNGQLILAAYTSFDKAGRELGIDATALAQSLDIAALMISLERLEVGRAGASSATCEWYEGIEDDAANELTALLHRLPMPKST